MRFSWLAALPLVLIPFLFLPAADTPKAPAPAALAGDEEDVILLRPNRPYHIRLHLQADGQPFRSNWNDVVAQLFRFLDRNGDGVLSATESAVAPSMEQFVQQQRGEPLEPDGPPDFGEDADRLTLDRFRTVYRPAGGSLTVTVLELNGVEAFSETLFTALDANLDGKLSRQELRGADEALARLDVNTDELVTAREVSPNDNPPSLTVVRPDQGPRNLPVLVVPGGDKDRAWTAALIKEYDRNRDDKLSPAEAGLDRATYRRLDANSDNLLTADELAGWLPQSPDLDVVVEMGQTAKEGRAHLLGGTGVAVARSREGVVLLPVGDGRVDLRAIAAGPGGAERRLPIAPNAFAGYDANKDGYIDSREASRAINSPMVAMLRLADPDGDGKVSQKEFTAYLELHQRLGTSSAALEFVDHGRSLFDFLDADQDGRLGLRELKTGWDRLEPWDRDRDGCITADEVPHQVRLTVDRTRPRLENQGPQMSPYPNRGTARRAQRTAGPVWFRKMDRNSDGDVSPREFLGRTADFQRIDADGDGLIDAVEAERADSEARKRP